MVLIQDRDASRRFFIDTWNKYKASAALESLEQLVLEVILEHPEYHNYLEYGEEMLVHEFTPEAGISNPFLHMGMHITIREQVLTDRPPGIKALHQELTDKGISGEHELEHRMMDCLGEVLWHAQRVNNLPDELAYLDCVRKLA